MIARLIRQAATLEPQTVFGHLGWLRGATGAALGIFLAGAVTYVIVGPMGGAFPWLVAPLGASAVLIFCVPASPLAQPWPVVGGDLLSAAAGLLAGYIFGSPWLAAGAAVGMAVAVMTLARCLHPPGGACALLCALGASGSEVWGWEYMIPIAANVLVLMAVGWAYNNLTGHPWPHLMPKVPQPTPASELSYRRDDMEAVLEEWDEILDVDVDDLDALFQAVERRVRSRMVSGGQ